MSGSHLRPLVLLSSNASLSRNVRALVDTEIPVVMRSGNRPLSQQCNG